MEPMFELEESTMSYTASPYSEDGTNEADVEIDSDVDHALNLCREIVEKCGKLSDRPEAAEFAASVSEKATSMGEWISSNNRVTEKMMTALENMKTGTDKWLVPKRKRGRFTGDLFVGECDHGYDCEY